MPPFVSRGLEIVRDPADSERWDDWRWQASSALRSAADLASALRLSPDEAAGAARAEAEGFPIAITPHTLSLIDRDDPACPIRRRE